MNELEMCKAMAEIEGVKFDAVESTNQRGDIETIFNYNPITDLALNCALRDKYRVSIVHFDVLDCGIDGNGNFDVPCCDICVGKICYKSLHNMDTTELLSAVIECILKSKGLWK